MAADSKYDTSPKQLCSDIEITIRIRDCSQDKKSMISKVPHNPQMFKLHNDFFTFDNIKWGHESQERVYKAAVYPFVERALGGHNATILAYGPTGTGKSYTMGTLESTMGNWQNSGLIQRSLKHIFEENEIQVSASFIEIYDEEIHDLLNIGAIVHTGSAFDSKIEKIKSLEEGVQLVNKALRLRQEHETSSPSLQNNTPDSQSHALLTLRLKIKEGEKFLESKLNLVDLAGSKTRTKGRVDERSHLDESLSALESVITRTWRKSDQMLFPKNSTLASILEDLLEPECLVSLIACISSDPASDYRATVRTLEVAESIRSVQIQRRMKCVSDSPTDQLKSKTKLPIALSAKTENIEIIDRQDQEPVITRAIGGKIKDCMVVLRKSDIDFDGNEKGLQYTEDTTPLNLSGVDTPNGKIPLTNYEAGCSAETESTLSISKLNTQITDQDIFLRSNLCIAEYSKYPTWFEKSFSVSSLEDMATVSPAKLHTNNDDKPDNKCECESSFHGFVSANELALVSQPFNHSNLKEKQLVLVNDVSQLSITGEEITVNSACPDENQGSSTSGEIREDEQLLEKPAELFYPAARVNRIKRMKEILTTDFSEPGRSEIDYQTPRKMIKLDMKNPKLILKRVSDPNPVPGEIHLDDNNYDNIEDQEKELNDKQRTHNNNILRILNTSTAEQLLDLPRIGFKTAVSIYQYRLIHGDFESLKSLENMPFWTEKIRHNFFAFCQRICVLVEMEGTQLAGLDEYICNESTDDEFVIPSDNNSKNLSSRSIENKGSNESGEGPASSSHPNRSAVKKDVKIVAGTSNTSESNLSGKNSTPDEAGVFSDNNLQNESVTEDSQQITKTRHRKKSIVFGSKKKSSFQGTENEEFDDSGIALDNSSEVCSPMKTQSVVGTNKFTSSKTNRSYNYRTSDKGEVLNDSLLDDSVAAESRQEHKIERKGSKVFATKRKLDTQDTEDEESEESNEKAVKRGRGVYKLRNISTNNFPENNSEVDDEDETEDSEEEKVEIMVKEETKKKKTLNEKGSVSKRQMAHNNKILLILNEGSIAQLRALNRVGPKAAMMIHQFRKLNGKLQSIQDLKNMTGWSPKFLDQFLLSNNIILD